MFVFKIYEMCVLFVVPGVVMMGTHVFMSEEFPASGVFDVEFLVCLALFHQFIHVWIS